MACSRALPSWTRRPVKPVPARSTPPPKRCGASTDLMPIEQGQGSQLPSSISRSTAVAGRETLCEPLGRKVLVSAALAAAATDGWRLEPLGAHVLRGIREPTKIFALRL